MRKKTGFTLIELLAVIVILGIIAVITVPLMLNTINASRKGVYDTQRDMVADAAELYYFAYEDDLVWDGDTSYVEVGTLASTGYLRDGVVNPLNNQVIPDDTKVLIYKVGDNIGYSLQLYDEDTFKWYQEKMIDGAKEMDVTMPTNIGEKTSIDLNTLIDRKKVPEYRIPTNLTNRCVGSVEIEKVAEDNYTYNAFVDCLTNASTFASHYVSYGGKYLDEFYDAKQTNDGGYIAVGRSNSDVITKYGTTGKGKYDAIIVKFDVEGNVEWSANFGGTNTDMFEAVIETSDGYVAVGQTTSNDLDLNGIYKGGNNDSILVKYNKNGDLVYKMSYGFSGTNGNDLFNDIIKVSDGYIVVGSACILVRDGDMTGVTAPGNRSAGIIIKFDNNFNTVWRSFFSGTYYESFTNVKKTSDNGFIVSGSSSSYDYDMTGLGYDNIYADSEAIILKYDSAGILQYKNSFKGSQTDVFYSAVEVSDGYVAVGNSSSINGDMTDMNKANAEISDAIIVKYDPTLSNVIWKKTFGGSDADGFNRLLKTSTDQLLAVGYSKSEDIDMQGIAISKGGYSNSIMVEYNDTGNVVKKQVFGGTNSDVFNSIIETNDNNFVIAGSTYSSNYNLQNFNKGHQDAILVAANQSLTLTKIFKEPVVLIDKLKTIQPNYGTNINPSYTNVYTTNNPEVDLEGWCSSYTVYAPNINYNYGMCLTPFNPDDTKLLTNGDNLRNFKTIHQGEYEYAIDNNPDNAFDWYKIFFYFTGGGGSDIQLSNFKLKFQDGYVGSIADAVNNGYIEPLVAVSSMLSYTDTYFFPNSIDIINTNGGTGSGNYPNLYINVKPKKSKLMSLIFTANRDIITNGDGLQVFELRNFDMSITPTS